MTAAALVCTSCGTELGANAKFCSQCGAPITTATAPAEYKQVTVLFADVVHSMDIAAAVGAERLREIMAELVSRCSSIVQRYGGTVDKFTGDGIMAVFGAPVALEDHAVRACLAALDMQQETQLLAREVQSRDGIDLRLRVGLNSGEVIAGEVGSTALGYTAIGEQVGMAQRMESVAPPGEVMASESTAQLVEGAALLADPELVHIKGADAPVYARRLTEVTTQHAQLSHRRSILVGREWELAALAAMVDRAINGHGCVASVVGPPGIGKSRIVAETAAIAVSRGAQVFSTFCESHTSGVPFHASRRLLRAALGVDELDDEAARVLVRTDVAAADPEDFILLEDALGIRDPNVELPGIDPDAARRRLTALVNTIALLRKTPGVFVIEDAHWIDPTSESLFVDFVSIVSQTRSLVLITHRPEYQGPLRRSPGAQTISLAPLDDSHTAALVSDLLGTDRSVTELTAQIADRAAGNPFFAEEIVRDLAARGVLTGERGAFTCAAEAVDVSVPATLQAAIAARVDRLDAAAKGTLNAAAVIGLRFGDELLTCLVEQPAISELITAELIDQVRFTPRAGYAFRHPLIRTVAYRSQLKSDRAKLHRRLASAIEQQDPESVDEQAALIAEHLQAAGDLREAYRWLMRAGTWLTFRDIKAARMSWQRARDVADRLAADDPDRAAMRVAPRALISVSTFRTGGSVADTGFDELRELASAAGDKMSLATGMAGQVLALQAHAQCRESAMLAAEFTSLVESIADPTLTVGLLWAALIAKLSSAENAEVLRLADLIIDLADGDPQMANAIVESPLAVAIALRATAQACQGERGWQDNLDQGLAMCFEFAPIGFPVLLFWKYALMANGILIPGEAAVRVTAEALELAQRYGDDFTLECARCVRGLVLVQLGGRKQAEGFELLSMVREAALQERSTMLFVSLVDIERAKDRARTGDLDGGIEALRALVDDEYATGEMLFRSAVVAALVDALLQRGTSGDVQEAHAAFERLAAVPTEPGFVVHEVHLSRMRALLAKARGDEIGYREHADRYRAMANSCGFEGHMALAEAMP
jgi:adenylate cyclase